MREPVGGNPLQPRRPWWYPSAALTRPFLASVERVGYDVRDPDVTLRVEVQVLYLLLAGASALLYAYTHIAAGSLVMTALFVLLAAGNGVLLAALRWTGRLTLLGHATLGLALLTITLATYWTGGLRLSNASPFFITLVAAVFLLGWKGLGWAAASVATPLAFQLAGNAGYAFPDHVPPDARSTDAFLTWLTALVVVGLFALYYESARALSVRRRAQAEATRSQFLANVSHELRTPLHAIMGMTEDALRQPLPDPARRSLETAKQSAHDLSLLIDDLLLLASMDRDHFVLEPRDFNPIAEIDRVASSLRWRCAEQGIDFTLEVSPDAPRWVRGDSDRLRQVLLNLGTNAIKFTERGSVTLGLAPAPGSTTGPETTDGEPNHPLGAVFTVADTGIGIAAEDRVRIFAPFTRAAPTTPQTHGVGLGLHIVQEIVTAMNGRVELDSTPGVGTTFRLLVRFEPPRSERHAPEEAEATPARAPSLRVLVVDDDPLNVRMAITMLEELGHQALVARNGIEAIEQWVAAAPNLILMDIQMPQLDGEEATRRIRQREQAEGRPPVPIIAVTGHGTRQHRQQYLAAGATHCLFKPFRFEELEHVIASNASHATEEPAA